MSARFKRCYSCATASDNGRHRLPADAERCPTCGGRSFYFGRRMTRRLWPLLPGTGKDTMTDEGEVIPGEWEKQVAKDTDPRWRVR